MKSELKSLARSFSCAGAGVWYCICQERNFRIHLTIGLWVLLLAGYLQLGRMRTAILLLVMGLVLALELLNTALEAVVDLACSDWHPLAKRAKDTAAGAVLAAAAAAVGIGGCLLWRPKQLLALGPWLLFSPVRWSTVLLLAAVSIWFIFYGGKKKKRSSPAEAGKK
ncbi:MAG: diacylglycerol kinase family protein [Anaerotruncus sp.]|nr:diacylglycerol kinase family protein [Anaerotruncus sp.]